MTLLAIHFSYEFLISKFLTFCYHLRVQGQGDHPGRVQGRDGMGRAYWGVCPLRKGWKDFWRIARRHKPRKERPKWAPLSWLLINKCEWLKVWIPTGWILWCLRRMPKCPWKTWPPSPEVPFCVAIWATTLVQAHGVSAISSVTRKTHIDANASTDHHKKGQV